MKGSKHCRVGVFKVFISSVMRKFLCVFEAVFLIHMNFFQVEGIFYVNSHLEKLMFDELRNACRPGMVGGFLPGMKQIANVAALPGIVGRSVGLPDVHSGYGFAIGIKAITIIFVIVLLYNIKL